LPADADWILYGPYSDKSLLRNTLAYFLFREMGHYSPRNVFCELYINSNFIGLYEAIEKIKYASSRINAFDTSAIFKIDKKTGSKWVSWHSKYDSNVIFQVNISDTDEIFRRYKDKVYKFEKMVFSDLFSFENIANLQSFIDFFLLQEFSGNPDGYRSSTFFYLNKDEKFCMGPVWDFDAAFGNCNLYSSNLASGWRYNSKSVSPNPKDSHIPQWWKKMLTNDTIRNQVQNRWFFLRKNIFSSNRIDKFIDSCIYSISESAESNFIKWQILGRYINWNAYVGSSYYDEIRYLKNWIRKRAEWMDANL